MSPDHTFHEVIEPNSDDDEVAFFIGRWRSQGWIDVTELPRQEDSDRLTAHTRRRVQVNDPMPLSRHQTDLLDEFSLSRCHRGLPWLVQEPSRDLPEVTRHWVSVLPEHHHAFTLVERHDSHSARVHDDVTVHDRVSIELDLIGHHRPLGRLEPLDALQDRLRPGLVADIGGAAGRGRHPTIGLPSGAA